MAKGKNKKATGNRSEGKAEKALVHGSEGTDEKAISPLSWEAAEKEAVEVDKVFSSHYDEGFEWAENVYKSMTVEELSSICKLKDHYATFSREYAKN